MDSACSAAINYDISNANTFLADRIFSVSFLGSGPMAHFFYLPM
jgi:hypothetical protein